MDKRCKEAMFAVAICTVLGPFVGWYAESYLGWHQLLAWCTAIVVSGITVYLTCDIAGVKAAIPRAWKYAIAESPWSTEDKRDRWSSFFGQALRGLVACNIFATWFTVPLLIIVPFTEGSYTVLVVGVISFVTLMLSWPAVAAAMPMLTEQNKEKRLRESGKLDDTWRLLAWDCNPITVLCYWLPIGSYLFIRYGIPSITVSCWQAIGVMARFTGRLYVLIHTSVRSMALMDTALVGGLFYFTYSPFWAVVGGLLGAVLFGINYMWIAQRVLKVRPV